MELPKRPLGMASWEEENFKTNGNRPTAGSRFRTKTPTVGEGSVPTLFH